MAQEIYGKHETLTNYMNRLEKRDKRIKCSKNTRIKEWKQVRKLQFNDRANFNGRLQLTKIRTGTFMFIFKQ